jgi:NTE family protein
VTQSPLELLIAILTASGLVGYASVFNEPINELATAAAHAVPAVPVVPKIVDNGDSTVVGLAFSGGGSRAAAFSYGILRELEATPLSDDGNGRSMLDAVRFIAGASGGAIPAAYYGLKGKNGYHDFREKFLIRDAQAEIKTATDVGNVLRVINGGVNEGDTFAHWLDENLYDGADFADMRQSDGPIVWLNASDLYNRTPFLFNDETFAALCSDLGRLPLAEAVAASNAVPVLFAPFVIATNREHCDYQMPEWLGAAVDEPSSLSSIRAFGNALETYREMDGFKYVKLVDGAVTDDYGVTSVVLARAASQTPYGPLSAKEAVQLKRIVYLVADAGRAPEGEWKTTLRGPGLVDLIMSITDTAIQNSARYGFDTLRLTLDDWRRDIIDYRCGLEPGEVERLRGSLVGWQCDQVELFVAEIDFHDLDADVKARLQKVLTRLRLPVDQVDLTIASGREAIRRSGTFAEVLKSMDGAVTAKSTTMPAGAASTVQ